MESKTVSLAFLPLNGKHVDNVWIHSKAPSRINNWVQTYEYCNYLYRIRKKLKLTFILISLKSSRNFQTQSFLVKINVLNISYNENLINQKENIKSPISFNLRIPTLLLCCRRHSWRLATTFCTLLYRSPPCWSILFTAFGTHVAQSCPLSDVVNPLFLLSASFPSTMPSITAKTSVNILTL